jgi:hypothetical protein
MWAFGRRKRTQKAEQREKELREFLTNHAENTGQSKEAQIAIAYCQHCICEYEDWFDWNEARWVGWQRVVIIGGGVIATLSGVITLPAQWLWWIPDPHSLSWLRGVPAAIVTIAAGYLSSFTYRDDAVRHEVTALALWNELIKYRAGAAPYNKKEDEDTSVFMNTICKIVETESQSWSAQVQGIRSEAEIDKSNPTNKPSA